MSDVKPGSVTAVCAILIGLFPALQTSRTDVVEHLKDTRRAFVPPAATSSDDE